MLDAQTLRRTTSRAWTTWKQEPRTAAGPARAGRQSKGSPDSAFADLRPATWAGLRARRYDRPHRLCPLPVLEARQAEIRANLDDSQIEETTQNVDGADTADLAFPNTDLPGTPDPVFLVLDHDD